MTEPMGERGRQGAAPLGTAIAHVHVPEDFRRIGFSGDFYGPHRGQRSDRCQGCEDAPIGQHTSPHDWEVVTP